MTGTSINDLKSYFSQADPVANLKAKAPKEGENSFSKAMSEAQARPVSVDDKAGFQGVAQRNTQGKTEVQNAGRKDLKEQVNSEPAEKGAEKAEDNEAYGKVSEKIDKIKKAIKDEFSVTDEELASAMEALGISDFALLNTEDVKALMMEITGTENAVDLLTDGELLESINDVTAFVEQTVDSLKEELSITDEQFSGLINRLEALSQEDLQAAVSPEAETGENESKPDPLASAGPFDSKAYRADEGTPSNERLADSAESLSAKMTQGNQAIKKSADPGEQSGEQGNANAENGAAVPQTIVQTEVNGAGEVVETVRYSSYSENAEIVNQVTEQIKVNISSESTSMEMMLHPASLGAVNIQVTQQGDILHAQILVQNEQVKDAIAGQMEQLLKTFAEQGQKVTEIDVSVANYNLEHGLNQNGGGQGNNEHQGSLGARQARRVFDLNALTDEDMDELSEDERLAAEVMSMSGISVEYRA